MFPPPAYVESMRLHLLDDLRAFLPELVLILTMVGLLLTRMMMRRPPVHLTIIALLGSLLSMYILLRQPAQPSSQHFQGLLLLDAYANFGRVFLLSALSAVLLMGLLTGIPDREDAADFSVMLIGSTLGMMFMCSSYHLLMMFIAFEMASLPSYALAGFLKGRRTGSEAALKYVIYGAASAGMMLYGISMIVARIGSGSFADLLTALPTIWSQPTADVGLMAGCLFVFIGLAFKLSLVPFQFWCPDVFQGAAAEVGAFLSVASKAATLILTGRLLSICQFPIESAWMWIGLSAITMTWGNLAALKQTNLQRMFAYSTIAHAGYLLMGLAAFPVGGRSAMLFYLVAYALMNIGAFTVIALIRNRTGSTEETALHGLIQRTPILAITMTLFLMSLLGLPPLAGFAAKFQLFASVIDAGRTVESQGLSSLAMGFYALVIIAAVNTVISLGYYLRIIRLMILEPASESPPFALRGSQSSYVIALAIGLVGIGIWWNPLSRVSERATESSAIVRIQDAQR